MDRKWQMSTCSIYKHYSAKDYEKINKEAKIRA